MPIQAKPLFRADVLKPKLDAFKLPADFDKRVERLRKWRDLIHSPKFDSHKETAILPGFLEDLFRGVLGYASPVDNPHRYTFSREQHVEVDGKFADGAIGVFNGASKFLAVLEGKGPLDPLDRPFAGRKMSAVDQGLRYAFNLKCDWILVTNLKEIRLYHKGNDYAHFERFETAQLADDEAQRKRFLFLLGADRVVRADGSCHLPELLSETEKIGTQVTTEYYKQFAGIRMKAFEQLAAANPDKPKTAVLTAAQKLLDRVLFCAFAEDRGLLPSKTVARAYEYSDPFNPRPIWDNFRGLFRSIDKGNPKLEIDEYNGGLFAPDPMLDKDLIVPDEVCKLFANLAEYDYRDGGDGSAGRPVDVDILGHIFEQSITDLERIHDKLEGRTRDDDPTKGRRKKEGAFYTPAFITRYIVAQTLKPVIAERFAALQARHSTEANARVRKVFENPDEIPDKATEPQRKALVAFWDAWLDELAKIRILDPSCGSGAFLIEAFNQMHKEYDRAIAVLTELRGSASLFDPDQRILQQNLYGVDLNDEAIEICRLSLWIKTAKHGQKLTSLDHTIRAGNSIVNDPAFDPKAFDWDAAFPEVKAAGGFDVIVGNPPYIRQEWLAPFKPHWQTTFESFNAVADIFTYFYELGVKRLRPDGRLGFITSGSWVRGNFGSGLRGFLAKNARLESVIDFGEYQPFEDAEMIRPSITIVRKAEPGGSMRLFKWLTNGAPPQNLSDIIAVAPVMTTNHLGRETWELETDECRALKLKLSQCGRTLDVFTNGEIYYGIKTGLSEVFIVNDKQRDELTAEDPSCASILVPLVQGTNLRSWFIEESGDYLIVLKSSDDFVWPWSNNPDDAEQVFQSTFPSIFRYLSKHKSQVIKRADQGRYWWELRTCSYWERFNEPKLFWPDITNYPRFAIDKSIRYIGDTSFMIPTSDYFLLGVLSSWATWFFVSKTAQPLRLRSDRWQYRLKGQYMKHVPIPDASEEERMRIAGSAEQCAEFAQERYDLETRIRKRLNSAFGQDATGTALGKLNQKAEEWWGQPFVQLGAALKTSFKLTKNPFQSPKIADEWEPYLRDKKAEHDALTKQLADAEAEINDRVYRLFNLTKEEIALLQREVEH